MPAAKNPELRSIARTLLHHKRAVAECLFEPLAKLAKWASDIEALGLALVIEREAGPPTDYLINFLRTDAEAWRDLYLGHMLEQLHVPGYSADDVRDLRQAVLDQQREGLLRLLSPHMDRQCMAVFERRLQAINSIVVGAADAGHHPRILLIGDCLLENIVTFLTIPLLEHGVSLQHEFVTTKNPLELRNTLRKFSGRKFDLIYFSPYSSAFNLILSETRRNPNPLRSRRKLSRLAVAAHRQTCSTLALLAEIFDCTICVQNTNNLRQHDGKPTLFLKSLLTRRPRAIVAEEVNALLDKAVFDMNQDLGRPLVRINEVALKSEFGEFALGRLFYASEKYHPQVLAQKLAVLMRDAILANTLLSTKKVVVIDLDDTVWKGTIGEGKVEHYGERQRILGRLKAKGILLTIVSRNDPRNVHWTGGVLQQKDFVAAQINWNPKPTSMRRIASELNLKLKDFVFIDDRADQLALVTAAIPEIQVLDATLDSSWGMLRAWVDSLPEQTGNDRTQLYHERRQRDSFLREEVEGFDANALFAGLGLKVDCHVPARNELARVAELINRTNQFNTCDSRTSLPQVVALSEASDHAIVVARARDKFGDMGIVSAMIVDVVDGAVVVSTWVLSCRVFGYGIEPVMLNYGRRLGQRHNRAVIQGAIVETSHNQPCHDVYANHGFVLQGAVWVSGTSAMSAEAAWLETTADDGANSLVRA